MKKLTYTLVATAFLLSSAIKAEAGVFEGAFFGLQLGETKTTEKVTDNLFFQHTNPGAPVEYDINPKGVTGGVLAGYRWKINNYILGIEASGSLSNARSSTHQYDDGGGHITDTQFSRNDTFSIGPKFGYLLMDHMMGFVGVDYEIGQFSSREIVNGAPAASCDSGTCPNGNIFSCRASDLAAVSSWACRTSSACVLITSIRHGCQTPSPMPAAIRQEYPPPTTRFVQR